MTLHTAKGLEWPVVVLTGLEHGLFPLARAEEQPDGLEEERRLCYVGLTRAKDKLYLTWARARRRGGELRPGIPSRFLRALPPEILDERRTTSLWAPDWRSAGRAARRSGGQEFGTCARLGKDGPTARPRRPADAPAPRKSSPGHAALREGRARPPPAVRQRHDPGTHRHRPGSQGVGRVRRRRGRRQAAARGLRRPRARMGERMSIGRDDVLHVAGWPSWRCRTPTSTGWSAQLNRIVDFVAQLDEVPATMRRGAVPPGPGAGGPARGRAGLGAAGAAAGRVRAGIRRGLLPGAAARRHGRPVTAAANAREPSANGSPRPSAKGLNATLHWSQALLDAEAARVDAAGSAGALAGHADRAQGQHRHDRGAHHLRLADPRGLRVALRRDRGAAAPRGRRDDRGQGEHGRVRHGLVHRALRLRAGAPSARSRSGARRLVRRLGGAGGGRRRARRARLRDRRLGAPAGQLLRRRRRQAELRPGEPLRPGGVRLVARCISVFGRTWTMRAGCSPP